MKMKGINIIERHAEKAFFVLVTLIFAAVVVWQFALGGNTVDVAGQSGVPVDQAYQQVARLADEKLGRMQQNQPDGSVPTDAPDGVGRVASALTYRGPGGALPTPLGIPVAGVGSGSGGPIDTGRDGIAVETVAPPRPDSVRAGVYAGAIDPLVVAATPELEAVVPAQQPYDLRAATVAARFDAAGLLDSLRRDPDGSGGSLEAIPEPWWRGRIEILDIEVERVEVLPDGARVEQTLIEPSPGRFSVREQLAAGVAPEQMQSIVSDARANARDIVQPRFWSVISGEPWTAPEPGAEDGRDEVAEIARLLRQLERLRFEIAQAEDALSGGGDARSMIDIFDPASGVLAQSVGGRGGGGGRDVPSARELEAERRERQQAAIEARLAGLRERETELVGRLTALGVNVEEGAVDQGADTMPDLPVRIPDAEELTIWAHDTSVEGGRQYAYRMRVAINNPLYGFDNNLAPASRDAAAEPVLYSEWTDWTTPVSIDHDLYWFATRANEGGRQQVGVLAPTATVEVYRFYYGYWRRDEARVRIGDPVGAAIDIADQSLPMFRIERPDEGAPFVAGRDEIGDALEATTGAVLLDVRSAAARSGAGRAIGVVVRDEGGLLATRDPADDLTSDLRRRLEQSAGAGLLAQVREPGAGGLPSTPERRQADERDNRPAGGDRRMSR